MKVSGNCEIKVDYLGRRGIDLQVKLGRGGSFCSLKLDKKEALELAKQLLEASKGKTNV